MLSMDDLLKGRQFDREIIILCVRWYLRFKLSFRDLVEMMAERGISLAHTTIMRWIARVFPAGVQEPGPAATKDHARRLSGFASGGAGNPWRTSAREAN
jgi:hypothetical protein